MEDSNDPSDTVIAELMNPSVDRRLRDLPSLVVRSTSLVWEAARRELVVTAALQAVSSAALAAQLLIGRELLKYLLGLHAGEGLGGAVPDVLVLSGAVAVVSLANVVRFEYQQLLGELVSRHALERVIRVGSRVDLLSFESSQYHDRLRRAMFNASVRPLQLTTGVLSIIGSALGVLAIGATLLSIQPLLAVLAAVAIVPVWIMTLRAGRALYKFGFAQTARDRRRNYLEMLLTQKEAAKEVRGYELAGHLEATYRHLYELRIADLRTLIRGRMRQGVLGAVATSALSGGTLGFLIWLVASHRLSLASAGTAAGGLLLLGTQLQGLVSGVGALYESALFVQDFVSFLELGSATPAGVAPAGETFGDFTVLEADRVSFTYPTGTAPALSDVSMQIRRGDVVALVGENGSGKSTLAKILAGLYPPASGSVRWDGRDLGNVDPAELRSRTAVLFQDFVHFQMTALQNISMGRWQRIDDREGAELAARRAEADPFLRDLPSGYDTQLGPEFFGGVDLSGGQWQRMALARAFFRDAALVILDEPTASLDPRSEAQLFGAVRELYAGRSVLLITHRMASVRHADFIYVLDGGRVAEEGTHEGLMARGGLYSELFNLQASSFRE
ncbi:MAG TPA: ABC transporter ATP-binding protein [Acidimicrobiales bacterium]|nr:ABC transporter ATP-binding protein [Acidimicrobiales bacterium]